jgi:RHS repeat-associated protein
VATRWRRDKLGRPIELSLEQKGEETTLLKYQWGFGDQLLRKAGALGQIHYHYDAVGRLAGATYEDGSEELRLADRVGNLFKDHAGKGRRYSAAGALLEERRSSGETIQYRYDEEGFLIDKEDSQGKRLRYEWDDAGNLSRVNLANGDWVKFTYDPFGRRVAKITPKKATYWLWIADVPLHEWSIDSPDLHVTANDAVGISPENQAHKQAIKRRYDHAPAPPSELTESEQQKLITWHFEPGSMTLLAKQVGGTIFSVVCDHLSTPIRAFDPHGRLVWSVALDTCGNVRRHSGELDFIPFRFPGQYHDVETGLYYNRFRYYAPDSGIYISQDPIRLQGGKNLYGYVGNSNSEIDFLGLSKSSSPTYGGAAKGDDTVSIFKAPQRGKGADQYENGYNIKDFSDGDQSAYFAKDRTLAEDYAKHYGEGVIELKIPRSTYETRLSQHEYSYQGGPYQEVVVPHSEFDVLNSAERIWHK